MDSPEPTSKATASAAAVLATPTSASPVQVTTHYLPFIFICWFCFDFYSLYEHLQFCGSHSLVTILVCCVPDWWDIWLPS